MDGWRSAAEGSGQKAQTQADRRFPANGLAIGETPREAGPVEQKREAGMENTGGIGGEARRILLDESLFDDAGDDARRAVEKEPLCDMATTLFRVGMEPVPFDWERHVPAPIDLVVARIVGGAVELGVAEDLGCVPEGAGWFPCGGEKSLGEIFYEALAYAEDASRAGCVADLDRLEALIEAVEAGADGDGPEAADFQAVLDIDLDQGIEGIMSDLDGLDPETAGVRALVEAASENILHAIQEEAESIMSGWLRDDETTASWFCDVGTIAEEAREAAGKTAEGIAAAFSLNVGGASYGVGLLLDAGLAEDAAALCRAVQPNSYGYTLLACAAENGRESVVEAACEAGADVDWRDNEGETALHMAARGDESACCLLLIANGADPFIRNDAGKTALDVAEGKAVEVLLAATEYASLSIEAAPAAEKPKAAARRL